MLSLKNQESVKKFLLSLRRGGAEILSPLSEWECARWRVNGQYGIMYLNQRGEISFNSPWTEDLFHAYTLGHNPVFKKKKPKKRSFLISRLLREVISRDGQKCCYCTKGFSPSRPPTLEHWLSRANGGTDHLANLAAAHESCNGLADTMSISEKFTLALKLRNPSHVSEQSSRPVKELAHKSAQVTSKAL